MRRIAFALAALTTISAHGIAQAVKPVAKPAPKPAPVKVSIDPGMSKAQVVTNLGKPASERTRGEFTYLYYVNGMEKQVGMSDLVTLQNDKVVDAVFRSPKRAYTGTSSSPRAISAAEARKAKPPAGKG